MGIEAVCRCCRVGSVFSDYVHYAVLQRSLTFTVVLELQNYLPQYKYSKGQCKVYHGIKDNG